MAQWIQSQALFLGFVLFFWVLLTGIFIGLRGDCETERYRQMWSRIIEVYQISIFALIGGNFIGYGPVQEVTVYIRAHWIFCIVCILISYYIGMLLLVNGAPIGSFTLTITTLIIMQAVFQLDLVTLISAVIYSLSYAKVISEFTEYNSVDVKIIDFSAIRSKLAPPPEKISNHNPNHFAGARRAPFLFILTQYFAHFGCVFRIH